MEFKEFEFLPNQDSKLYDLRKVESEDINDVYQEALKNPNCIAFNTYGWLKDFIRPELIHLPNKNENVTDGLYIKRKINFKYKTILLIDEINNQDNNLRFQPDVILKNIDTFEDLNRSLSSDSDADFYIVIKNTTFQVHNFSFYLQSILETLQYLEFDLVYLGYNLKYESIDKYQDQYISFDAPKLFEFNKSICSSSNPNFAYIVHQKYLSQENRELEKGLLSVSSIGKTSKIFEVKPFIVWDRAYNDKF